MTPPHRSTLLLLLLFLGLLLGVSPAAGTNTTASSPIDTACYRTYMSDVSAAAQSVIDRCTAITVFAGCTARLISVAATVAERTALEQDVVAVQMQAGVDCADVIVPPARPTIVTRDGR